MSPESPAPRDPGIQMTGVLEVGISDLGRRGVAITKALQLLCAFVFTARQNTSFS